MRSNLKSCLKKSKNYQSNLNRESELAIVVKGETISDSGNKETAVQENRTLGGYFKDRSQPEVQLEELLEEVKIDNEIQESTSKKDSLSDMFIMREEFMKSLRKKFPTANPEWPLDLSQKEEQQYCRDIALRGVEEMFEALQHLKNWKPHRTTEITEFAKDEFLEEIVDAFNYFFSLLILTGHTSKDLYEAYLKKDEIIHERLKGNY